MKVRADLNETRNHEKQMWNVVNEKRDVNKGKLSPSPSPYVIVEIETTTKRKQRTSFGQRT